MATVYNKALSKIAFETTGVKPEATMAKIRHIMTRVCMEQQSNPDFLAACIANGKRLNKVKPKKK